MNRTNSLTMTAFFSLIAVFLSGCGKLQTYDVVILNGRVMDPVTNFDGIRKVSLKLTVGWTPSQADRYTKDFHVMLWHADKREGPGISESYGVTFGSIWKSGTIRRRIEYFPRSKRFPYFWDRSPEWKKLWREKFCLG